MDFEGIMLIEINQRKTNTVWYPLHVESKKYEQSSEYNKKSSWLTDLKIKLVIISGEGEGQYRVQEQEEQTTEGKTGLRIYYTASISSQL